MVDQGRITNPSEFNGSWFQNGAVGGHLRGGAPRNMTESERDHDRSSSGRPPDCWLAAFAHLRLARPRPVQSTLSIRTMDSQPPPGGQSRHLTHCYWSEEM